MNNQVRDFVRQCDTCQRFGPKQQKETMIPHMHDVVYQPWIKAGADRFHFDGRDYLITVDYFSNYCEVDYLAGDTSSSNVINKLRAHLPGMASQERCTRTTSSVQQLRIQGVCGKWNFEHTTSSPEHPQSKRKSRERSKNSEDADEKSKIFTHGRLAGNSVLPKHA